MHKSLYLAATSILGAILAPSSGHTTPIVAGNYYEDRINPTCPQSFDFCRGTFSATPAGRVLNIERIACTVTTTQPITKSTLNVATTANGSATRTFGLAFAKTVQVANLHYYNVNEEVKIRVGAGRYPYIMIEYPNIGTAHLDCVIIGTLL